MRRCVPMVVAALALLLAACGAHGPNAGGVSTTVDEPPPVVSEPDRDEVYEANGMVCEDGTRGPLLWLGGIALVLGPQPCGGIPLVSWDWRTVDGEETAGGTISGYLPRRGHIRRGHSCGHRGRPVRGGPLRLRDGSGHHEPL